MPTLPESILRSLDPAAQTRAGLLATRARSPGQPDLTKVRAVPRHPDLAIAQYVTRARSARLEFVRIEDKERTEPVQAFDVSCTPENARELLVNVDSWNEARRALEYLRANDPGASAPADVLADWCDRVYKWCQVMILASNLDWGMWDVLGVPDTVAFTPELTTWDGRRRLTLVNPIHAAQFAWAKRVQEAIERQAGDLWDVAGGSAMPPDLRGRLHVGPLSTVGCTARFKAGRRFWVEGRSDPFAINYRWFTTCGGVICTDYHGPQSTPFLLPDFYTYARARDDSGKIERLNRNVGDLPFAQVLRDVFAADRSGSVAVRAGGGKPTDWTTLTRYGVHGQLLVISEAFLAVDLLKLLGRSTEWYLAELEQLAREGKLNVDPAQIQAAAREVRKAGIRAVAGAIAAGGGVASAVGGPVGTAVGILAQVGALLYLGIAELFGPECEGAIPQPIYMRRIPACEEVARAEAPPDTPLMDIVIPPATVGEERPQDEQKVPWGTIAAIGGAALLGAVLFLRR